MAGVPRASSIAVEPARRPVRSVGTVTFRSSSAWAPYGEPGDSPFEQAGDQPSAVGKERGEVARHFLHRAIHHHQRVGALAALRLHRVSGERVERADQWAQQCGEVSLAVADEQRLVIEAWLRLGQHHAVHQWRGELAAVAERDRAVDIGGVAHGRGHEILARDCRHGIENPRFIDAAGAQLAVDHGAAGSGVGAGAALLCGRHHSKIPS